MKITIRPSSRIRGRVELPGDKSISHRLAMLGAIAKGKTVIRGFSGSADCTSTLNCLRQLGVGIESPQPGHVVIRGRGLRGLEASELLLDAGNSGSTLRMLSGILAGQHFSTTISGDPSLRRRPMRRIIDPLSQMGAEIQAGPDNTPPLSIRGGDLQAIDYPMPVASAQVKSAILLAGLYASGTTRVVEPLASRDHTEIALRQFGVGLQVSGRALQIRGGQQPLAQAAAVPGDLSSAAFLIAATLLLPNSETLVPGVGLNPRRRALVDVLIGMGAAIDVIEEYPLHGELAGDLRIRSSNLRGGSLSGALIPQLIDEIPILAVLAPRTQEGIHIRDAAELRVKESDRIQSIVENLRAMGVAVEEYPDGMSIPGRQSLRGGLVDSHGDHRIAMAFSIAGLVAGGPTVIGNADCVSVSFPGFYDLLARLTQA